MQQDAQGWAAFSYKFCTFIKMSSPPWELLLLFIVVT
uniref:Uncharacterized protein n=1 Tax=Anguilla anguilla TaxID=7936 RepID=A0A0E9RNQ9_ANGAN